MANDEELDDLRFLLLPEEDQREIVISLLGVSGDYPIEGLIDWLLSVRRQHGYNQFFWELSRVKSPDLMATVEKIAHVPQIAFTT